MANRISTTLDLDDRGFLSRIKAIGAEVGAAEGLMGKLKAGWAGVTAEFQNNKAAQAAAVGGLAVVAKQSIDAASNLEESINAVNVAYGDASESVLALGGDSAESFGLSKRAFNDFSVQFSAFANQIAGETGQQVSDVVKDMTTRVADFASVMNLDVPEAARIFQSALAGETEPIRKFGIDLSAAAVSAHAVETGMVASAKEMTEATKVQARYSLLMQSTSKVQGDFASTADGLANATRIAQAQIEDLQAKLGTLLIPAVAEAVGTFNDFVGVLEEVKSVADGLPGPLGEVSQNIDKIASAASLGVFGAKDLHNALVDIASSKIELDEVFTKDQIEEITGNYIRFRDHLLGVGEALGVVAAEGENNVNITGMQVDSALGFLDVLRGLEGGIRDKAEAFVEANEREREAMEAGAEAAEDYRDRIDSSFHDAASSVTDFSDEANSSFAAWKSELTANTAAADTFFNHLVAIGRETSPEFVEHLASMGVGALDMVAEMRATEGGVQDAFRTWTDAAEVMGRDLSAELGNAATGGSKAFRAAMGNEHKAAFGLAYKQGKEIGAQQMAGVRDGITAGQAAAVAAARAAGRQIAAATRAGLEIAS